MQQQYFAVVVPAGYGEGSKFQAMCGEQLVEVVVPPGVSPGQQIQVAVQAPIVVSAVAVPVPPPSAPPGQTDRVAPSHMPPTPIQSLEIEPTPEADPDPPPRGARWDSTRQMLLRAYPIPTTLFFLGFTLVFAGKFIQEVNRPAETATLWEASICPDSVNTTEWVGHYDGPGFVCPYSGAKPNEQSWTITPEAAGLLPWRSYHLIMYVSTGAKVDLTWSLADGRGAQLVPRTRALNGGRRRLLELPRDEAGAAGGGTQAAAAAAQGALGTQRELLKGGSGGSGGGGGGSSGGSGGRSPGRSSGSYSASSATRSYQSSARTTAYGRRGTAVLATGAYMGHTARRRSGRSTRNDDSSGGESTEETYAEEDLDRLDVTTASFETPLMGSGRYPLRLTAHSLAVQSPKARVITDPPYVFLGFFTDVTERQLALFDWAIAVWVCGVVLICAVCAFALMRYVKDKAALATNTGTKALVAAITGAATWACFFAGCVAASSPVPVTEGLGVALIILTIVIFFGTITNQLKMWRAAMKAMKDQPARTTYVILAFSGIVGLTLTLCFAVLVDQGLLLYYIGVAVGMLIVETAWLIIWLRYAKAEHVNDKFGDRRQ